MNEQFLLSSFLQYLLPCLILFYIIIVITKELFKIPIKKLNFQILVFCFVLALTAKVFFITLSYLVHNLNYSINYIQNSYTHYEESAVKNISNHSMSSAHAKPNWRNVFLFAHIFFAMGCTFLGPLLFLKPYRYKHPKYHRLIGKIYVFGTLLSAILVLPLSTTNVGGTIPRICFTVMAILWGGFTYTAYCYARKKNFVEHRRWAMRSYAMTLAFVHVNLTYKMLGVYVALGDFPLAVKVMQSFVSWASNLLIVEIYLAATTFKGRFVGKKKWFENFFSKERFRASKHLKILTSKN